MNRRVKTEHRTRLITAGEEGEWRSILPAGRSVFGSVEFCSVVQRLQGLQACLFVFGEGRAQVAYPFFLRGIETLPYLGDEHQGWDTKSPEYTGPILLQAITPEVAAAYRQAFNQACREMGVIAEFAHLHPWAGNQDLLDPGGVRHDRQIVYVDLSMPLEQMWAGAFNHACRKNIRRAEREQVRVFPARTAAEIQEFHRVYIGTMDRNQASSHYYFPLSYFTDLMEALPDNTLMLLAEYRDQVVAGTLYLHDGENIYSYLGGADQAYQQVRPTNAVIYEAIRWGQAQGKNRLILGGGYQPDDGIFRFKASFSPLRADFFVYRFIHLDDEYQRLCQAWSSFYTTPIETVHFFPSYRAVPPDGTTTISVASEISD